MKSMFDNLSAIVSNTLTDSIQMIDIDELHESADNFFVVEKIEEFANTILGQGGVKDNLIVRPLDSGGYEIISGHRRRAAVQYLIDHGKNISHFLPCLVQNYDDEEDKMLDLILMNVSARQLSDQEMWKCYETIDKILKERKEKGEYYGRLRDDIAATLGVSSAQVGKMQNVEKNAIESVKEAVASGELSISTANEIAKLDKKEQSKITDLSKVQPKDIKKKLSKKIVVTKNNDESLEYNDNEEVIDTSIDDEPELQAKLREEVKRDNGETSVDTSSNYDDTEYILNKAIKGYLILAAEEASFTKEQINALLGGMMKVLSNYSLAEAESFFLSRK